jgi:hypothetical protein
MSHYFNQNGSLNENGKRLLTHFKGALDQLFNSMELHDLNKTELLMLSTTMLSMVSNRITNRLAFKQKKSDEFRAMTDQEFEAYMNEKYGSVWKFLELTEEEEIRSQSLR